MSSHRLSPLLTPRSVAVIGASTREGAPGNNVVRVAQLSGFGGAIYPINPRYEAVEGLACYADVADLPAPPDLAVLVVGDERLEAALGGAIRSGVKAAVIFGSANLLEDAEPRLPARLQAMSREAGLPVCGGNGMGFYNPDHRLDVTFARPAYATRRGHISFISHSGSSWSSLTLNDGRLGFNLAVSAGQELTVTAAEYLDYVVELETTRVVGLILETVRAPDAFMRALGKANERGVPVVALKVGRTPQSARLAVSHSGAIAGDDAAYEALFDRYGVGRAHTLEELAATLLLLSQSRPIGPGGLVASLDSGCERELLIDLAADEGVSLTDIEPATVERLAGLLHPGLEPVNPLDAWGTAHDYERIFIETFCALMNDPGAALGFAAHSARNGAWISNSWMEVCREATRRQGKPVALVTNFPWTRHHEIVEALGESGIPVIEGMRNALVAARLAFEHRDFLRRPPITPPEPVAGGIKAKWRRRLIRQPPLDEVEALALLQDYGVPVVRSRPVDDEAGACDAAKQIGLPVVLKTAMPGILHKSEVNGVRLGLDSLAAVATAYRDLSERLGPKVLVASMVESGVEMSLGMVLDPQLGPLVMLGAGGILIELLRDRVLALPPLDQAAAIRLLDRLAVAKLLRGYRGRAPVSIEAMGDAVARLSGLAGDLGDLIAELDINPIVVTPTGATAVDALVITMRTP